MAATDLEITELLEFDVSKVAGVGSPANGTPILLMKQQAVPTVNVPVTVPGAVGGIYESPQFQQYLQGVAAEAMERYVAKGTRDCPKCDKSYDADHQGGKCENCGTELPDAPAAKAADDAVDCPTCKGDGKIMGDKRDCPDCDAKGQVSPAKAKSLAAKSLARGILADLASVAKAVGADGKVDEAPDIDKANQILALLGEAIAAEAQEMAAGQAGEADDILELACAANAVRCWRDGEQAVSLGDVMPASMLMQSAAEPAAKAKHSAEDRRKLAEQGNALSDGSYPIGDEEDLKSAAILAQSGHGDVDGAKRLIGRRAKELGVKNPLDNGETTSKSQLAGEVTEVNTDERNDGHIAKAVEEALAQAAAPLEKLRKELEETLAKVKATPIPGGPRMTAVPQAAITAAEDRAAMAKRIRDMADSFSDPAAADGYRQWAREIESEAKAS